MERFMEHWDEIKKDASRVDGDYVERIWDWFGYGGALIGRVRAGDKYDKQGMTDEARTPFERLYYVHDAVSPIVALRLHPEAIKESRISDSMEIVMRRCNMDDPQNGLVLYTVKWEATPEAYGCVSEAEFLATFPDDKAIRIV